jgi:hypothetical protein
MRFLPLVFVSSLAFADVSAPPASPTVAARFFEAMLDVVGPETAVDETSPVRGPHQYPQNRESVPPVGIRDFGTSGASNGELRGAVFWGIVRVGGGQLVPPSGLPPSITFAIPGASAQNLAILDAAAKKLFGRPLRKSSGAYDAAGLQAAWKMLYVKPSTQLGPITAQVAYDTLFKSFFRKKLPIILAVIRKKGFLQEQARLFAEAKTDYHTLQANAVAQLPPEVRSDPALVGTLIRRHADGTLPVVLQMINDGLLDYDKPMIILH